MDFQIDPKLIKLIQSTDHSIHKAIHEGLNLWLKTKLTQCPITNKYCTNNKNPCNDCETFTKPNKNQILP